MNKKIKLVVEIIEPEGTWMKEKVLKMSFFNEDGKSVSSAELTESMNRLNKEMITYVPAMSFEGFRNKFKENNEEFNFDKNLEGTYFQEYKDSYLEEERIKEVSSHMFDEYVDIHCTPPQDDLW